MPYTELIEAAQQALDYIRSTADYKMGHPPACEAALDLVDALAEPQSAEHGEHAAIVIEHEAFTNGVVFFTPVDGEAIQLPIGTKLYTKAQPRKRLTDEDIRRIGNSIPANHRFHGQVFARAIEAAVWGDGK